MKQKIITFANHKGGVSKTGIEQGERTEEQMVDFINEYEYENEETYFYIRLFTFE